MPIFTITASFRSFSQISNLSTAYTELMRPLEEEIVRNSDSWALSATKTLTNKVQAVILGSNGFHFGPFVNVSNIADIRKQ